MNVTDKFISPKNVITFIFTSVTRNAFSTAVVR